LDDEDHSGKGKKPKKKAPSANTLDPSEGNSTVTEVFPNQARVRLDQGGEILSTYRRAQVIQSSEEGFRERTPVAVGDRVRTEKLNPQSGVIDGICARRNYLARPAPGRDDPNLIHVIAANIDLLVIVASVELPEFSPGLIDRYLIAAQAAAIPVLICVTKSDLLKPEASQQWESYGKLGYPWVLMSARNGEHVEDLKKQVSGKTVVFCGHSGVGKTSLFRVLTNRPELGRIGDVNLQTGKGKHTTTSAVLYRDEPTRSDWIDTPGVREFGLIGITSQTLAVYFPEFANLECTQRGCLHVDEEGCQATELFRYVSYRRIHESLVERENQNIS
jgi:ribosome biogenesis GTPase